jgi:eukaryotic-like serine/threonine-protein kinase
MHPQLVQLFRDALDLAPQARSAYLDALDIAPDLRAQIAGLLRIAEHTEVPLPDLTLQPDVFTRRKVELADRSGEQIGAFRLLKPLGSGGMGAVWLAERSYGFSQQVAIKWLHAGFSASARQRFARERETLAKLDHPGIARIVDGGSDGDADWFAMEFVPGLALDAYVKSAQCSLFERIKLVIDLCDAVRYAHQNLIVHRDLKPSNVLVGATGQPKLLDFGVAKILDDANQTESRAPMTFAYAAPEQIRGDPITTATDVYALGVILYELLTGDRPHKPKGDGSLSMLQAITDTDATAPSSALSKQTQNTIKPSQLKGDLDTIVLKALSRDPAKRYFSAQSLSEDLQRYLGGQPISARKISVQDQINKWIRRNKLASAALALAVFAMLAGTTVSLIQRLHAIAQQKIAEQNAVNAKAVKDFVLRAFTGANRWTTGREVSALELAHRGFLEVETQLKDQPAAQFEVYSTLANVFGRNSPQRLTIAASEKRLALLDQLPNLTEAQRFLAECDHVSYLWWAERLDEVRKQIYRVQQRYPKLLATNAVMRNALEEIETLMLAARQDYSAFRRSAVQAVLRRPGEEAYVVESYLASADGVEFRVSDGLSRFARIIKFGHTSADRSSPNRAWSAANFAVLLAEFVPSAQSQALAVRAVQWCETYFGAESGYCDRFTQPRLRAALAEGRVADAEAYFQRSFAINNRYPEESIIELQPLLYLGAITALAAGDAKFAGERTEQALNLGLRLCGKTSSCVRSATALKMWLTRTPQALAELENLSALQLQNDDGEAWRSQMWLANAALDLGDSTTAKAHLQTISKWLSARGAGPDAALVKLYQRAGLPVPITPQYDVTELMQMMDGMLSDGEKMQRQRAKLAPNVE